MSVANMFKPECLPILIGSLPLTSHEDAVEVIFSYSPDIPLWPQLPKLPGEGMVRQFLTGFPGLREEGERYWVDTGCGDFEEQMTAFYQDYLRAEEDCSLLPGSRFALGDDTAAGFSVFVNGLEKNIITHTSLKGQVTGPVTTGIGAKDQDGRGIFYDENLRDMLVKMLSMKSRYQVEQLKKYTSSQPIIFIDEPGIVSFGSTGFMGVTREMVSEAVAEVVFSIKDAGGLAGVHICANGDWGPVLTSDADIISFDAYFYFDNFILYSDSLSAYLEKGGILAWGIVPTADPELLQRIEPQELFEKWRGQVQTLAGLGFTEKQLMQQTLIAPSCGTGSLSIDLAIKVLSMTNEVSRLAREYLRQC